jgi:hypothetical protein
VSEPSSLRGAEQPVASGVSPEREWLTYAEALGKDSKPESASSAYLREVGQGCQESQEGHGPRCIHGFPEGAGCYLCDPEHPFRRRQEDRK